MSLGYQRCVWSLLCAVVLAACNVSGVRGSGVEASTQRDVASFSTLSVGGKFTVDVTLGGTQSVRLVGDDNLLPLVTTTVKGGELVVNTSEQVDPRSGVRLVITAPDLARVKVSGAVKVQVAGVRNAEFEFSCSGACDAALRGETKRFVSETSGASSIDARQLRSVDSKVSISGAGSTDVCVTGALDASVSGVGSVKYSCDPRIVRPTISGIGTVSPAKG